MGGAPTTLSNTLLCKASCKTFRKVFISYKTSYSLHCPTFALFCATCFAQESSTCETSGGVCTHSLAGELPQQETEAMCVGQPEGQVVQVL